MAIQITKPAFVKWDFERITLLSTPDARQLRSNAERLGQEDIVALCDQILRSRPRGVARVPAKRRKKSGRTLVSRSKAFELRDVSVPNVRSSWGGVRKADNTVVLSLWKDAIRSEGGTCSYLLWAPNVAGGRPWSDKPGGKERLEHCKLALANGAAEALLVYGVALEGVLPEDRALTVEGVDADTVVMVQVERRGEEFWAVWGKRAAGPAAQGTDAPSL